MQDATATLLETTEKAVQQLQKNKVDVQLAVDDTIVLPVEVEKRTLHILNKWLTNASLAKTVTINAHCESKKIVIKINQKFAIVNPSISTNLEIIQTVIPTNGCFFYKLIITST